eukprot:TRINITY_DN34997_c0_g1_i1.p1 TRINITY_DN34997_c0_g1~~TRINITY_DN34997_c0_g1_i1.p1  ORF type:complete len:570 (+),score=156.28 TRINITY_DN34997_c0_g1_i1:103-1812(+)
MAAYWKPAVAAGVPAAAVALLLAAGRHEEGAPRAHGRPQTGPPSAAAAVGALQRAGVGGGAPPAAGTGSAAPPGGEPWAPPQLPQPLCAPPRCLFVPGESVFVGGALYSDSAAVGDLGPPAPGRSWPSPAAVQAPEPGARHWWPQHLKVPLRPLSALESAVRERGGSASPRGAVLVQPPVAAACFVNLWHTLDHAIVLHAAARALERRSGEPWADLVTWGCGESAEAGRYDGAQGACGSLDCAQRMPLFALVAAPFRRVLFMADMKSPAGAGEPHRYAAAGFGVDLGCSLHQAQADGRGVTPNCPANLWGYRGALLRRVFAPSAPAPAQVTVQSAACPRIVYLGRGEGAPAGRGPRRSRIGAATQKGAAGSGRFRRLHNLPAVLAAVGDRFAACSPPAVVQLRGPLAGQLAQVQEIQIAIAARGAATSWIAWLPVNAGFLSLDAGWPRNNGEFDERTSDEWRPYHDITPSWVYWKRRLVRMTHHDSPLLPPEMYRRSVCPFPIVAKRGKRPIIRGKWKGGQGPKDPCRNDVYPDANRCGLFATNVSLIASDVAEIAARLRQRAEAWGLR